MNLERLKCSCCGKEGIKHEVIDFLYALREITGLEFDVTSGFRCEKHNKEVGGADLSAHITGEAVDITALSGREIFILVRALMSLGVKRIGISFRKHFVHFDIAKDSMHPQEVIWNYD